MAEAAAHLLQRDGQQVRLILLDPVCREDFHVENRSGLLRLMAQGAKTVELPDDLEQLSASRQLEVFMGNATRAGVLKNPPEPEQARQWLERIEHLMKLLTRHSRPHHLDLPCLWLTAEGRPQHWQPAEQDWQDWAAQARRQSMACDHWQLLLDPQQVERTAAVINDWLAATDKEHQQ